MVDTAPKDRGLALKEHRNRTKRKTKSARVVTNRASSARFPLSPKKIKDGGIGEGGTAPERSEGTRTAQRCYSRRGSLRTSFPIVIGHGFEMSCHPTRGRRDADLTPG